MPVVRQTVVYMENIYAVRITAVWENKKENEMEKYVKALTEIGKQNNEVPTTLREEDDVEFFGKMRTTFKNIGVEKLAEQIADALKKPDVAKLCKILQGK